MNTQLSNETDISELRKADSLEVVFTPFHEAVAAMERRAAGLEVKDVSEIEKMAEAKKTRLEVVKLRTAVVARHKELKEYYLKGGRRVDEFKNAFLRTVEPMEAWLKLQETFADRLEAAKIKALHDDRARQFAPFSINFVAEPDFGRMTEDDFQAMLADAKAMADARHKREEAEEEARKAEAERLRLLEIEAVELRRKERERQVLLQQADEAAAKLQRDLDAALTREKLEQARLKREAEAKLEAEEYARKLEIQQKREADEALARAGDREKLEMFTENLRNASENRMDLIPPDLRGAVASIIADAVNEIHNLI